MRRDDYDNDDNDATDGISVQSAESHSTPNDESGIGRLSRSIRHDE